MVVGELTVDTDLLILGGGPGGYVAAIRAGQLGLDVTLVDRDGLGGVCLNRGCIPSKALITMSHLAYKAQHMTEAGIHVSGLEVRVPELQAWKQGVVDKLVGGVRQLCEAAGVALVSGTGTFTAPHELRVQGEFESQRVRFKQAIVATGSRPVELSVLPFDHEFVCDSTDALAWQEVPARLCVVGGGYIGLELGTVYAKLGSEVTVLEATDSLLPGTDPALVRVVARRLKDLGVRVELGAKASGVKRSRKGPATVQAEGKGGPLEVAADRVLVTVGRVPLTEGIGLEHLGLAPDARGFLAVDAQRRTQVPHVFAIGDITGGPLLAHKASHEGKVAAEVAAGEAAAYDVRFVPAVIYTDPEIASVGYTEAQAREHGYEVVTGRFPFAALGRALTTGEADGYGQVVADAATGELLGLHVVGPEASNLIAEGGLALEMYATLEDVAGTIHAHPTLPEVVMEAVEGALGRPIHQTLPKRRAAAPQG
jgi:dihydrolipoamide dehydrogenase